MLSAPVNAAKELKTWGLSKLDKIYGKPNAVAEESE